ncbi:MAG: hypothetical protein ABSA41_12585 [Terriglobia bacterium]|jgi:hypothetical protein
MTEEAQPAALAAPDAEEEKFVRLQKRAFKEALTELRAEEAAAAAAAVPAAPPKKSLFPFKF